MGFFWHMFINVFPALQKTPNLRFHRGLLTYYLYQFCPSFCGSLCAVDSLRVLKCCQFVFRCHIAVFRRC